MKPARARELVEYLRTSYRIIRMRELTHQSVIKTTFLLYVTISGAIARE